MHSMKKSKVTVRTRLKKERCMPLVQYGQDQPDGEAEASLIQAGAAALSRMCVWGGQ